MLVLWKVIFYKVVHEVKMKYQVRIIWHFGDISIYKLFKNMG